MLRRLATAVRPALAVDLGSARTRVAAAGLRIHGTPRVVDEPTVVAVARGSRRVLNRGAAVGRLAAQMLGRTPEGVDAVRPVRGGVVADFDLTEALLHDLLNRARRGRRGPRSPALLALAGGLTAVERRAAVGCLRRAGAGTVRVVDAARAAALGAGLPVTEPLATCVAVVGAATTEVAVLSLGDRLAGRSVRGGANDWAAAVRSHLRTVHGLRVDDGAAAAVVAAVGSAAPFAEARSCEASGLDVAGRVPRSVVLTDAEVRDALADPLEHLVEAITETIEEGGVRLAADLARAGLTLCGGGARLHGLTDYLAGRLNVPVRVAADPATAVVRGAATVLEQPDVWRHWAVPAERAA